MKYHLKAYTLLLVMLSIILHDAIPHVHHQKLLFSELTNDHIHDSDEQHRHHLSDHDHSEGVLNFLITHHSHAEHSKNYVSNAERILINVKQLTTVFTGTVGSELEGFFVNSLDHLIYSENRSKLPDLFYGSCCSHRGPPSFS